VGIEVLPSAEQAQVVDAVARALADAYPISRLAHGATPASFTAQDWTTAGEMGWLSLGLPEEAGGAGYDLTDAVLLLRLFGRHLLTPCLGATIVAARLAYAAGESERVAALAEGRAFAAFALRRSGDPAGGDLRLLDAEGAEAFVLLDAEGARLLDRAAVTGLEPVAAMDTTTPLFRGQLTPGAAAADAAAGLWARTLIAAELSGLAQAAVEQAVAYAKVREQFGKPIGSFQAVAHACADSAMRAEAAVAQTNFAAIRVRDGAGDAAFQVAAALLVAGDAAFRNATSNIQTHGGMGYSSESDAHLYLKRAMVLRALTGGDGPQREALLEP
jgi:alkylation response protein AidB-like acyl-CoA dehydrogenase